MRQFIVVNLNQLQQTRKVNAAGLLDLLNLNTLELSCALGRELSKNKTARVAHFVIVEIEPEPARAPASG